MRAAWWLEGREHGARSRSTNQKLAVVKDGGGIGAGAAVHGRAVGGGCRRGRTGGEVSVVVSAGRRGNSRGGRSAETGMRGCARKRRCRETALPLTRGRGWVGCVAPGCSGWGDTRVRSGETPNADRVVLCFWLLNIVCLGLPPSPPPKNIMHRSTHAHTHTHRPPSTHTLTAAPPSVSARSASSAAPRGRVVNARTILLGQWRVVRGACGTRPPAGGTHRWCRWCRPVAASLAGGLGVALVAVAVEPVRLDDQMVRVDADCVGVALVAVAVEPVRLDDQMVRVDADCVVGGEKGWSFFSATAIEKWPLPTSLPTPPTPLFTFLHSRTDGRRL